MSERSALVELAGFIGRSPLASPDPTVRNKALSGMTERMLPRQRRSVGDLLAVVMTLSARTRRMAQEPTQVEIDVFAPGGKRAVRLTLGE
ncbi:hypothetical protein [Devosia faecipullorum]|uniref:hypothetical protein n=1 Tax=Devosia faecipullorum TaxID=2755039 RepID=UPI00187B6178|nr:hypothetical protein [Devosia faecipullorum]MBE7731525.1 hypothetical protein [Devosia faecipullorum]